MINALYSRIMQLFRKPKKLKMCFISTSTSLRTNKQTTTKIKKSADYENQQLKTNRNYWIMVEALKLFLIGCNYMNSLFLEKCSILPPRPSKKRNKKTNNKKQVSESPPPPLPPLLPPPNTRTNYTCKLF